MPDTTVKFAPYAQSPLHGFGLPERARAINDSCGVWMNEVPLLGYIVLRGDSQLPEFVNAVTDVLGVAPPAAPCSAAPCAGGVLLWQGPDEWLLVCARAVHADCLVRLEAALAGIHAQVADNAGGLTMVYLSGAHHTTLLRHVSVYDIEAIVPGRVVGTVCGKAAMTLYRVDGDGICVIFRRSFADYIWRLLEKSARPYGLGITSMQALPGHAVLGLI
jgi:sarcosine oxidase subunit gamma